MGIRNKVRNFLTGVVLVATPFVLIGVAGYSIQPDKREFVVIGTSQGPSGRTYDFGYPLSVDSDKITVDASSSVFRPYRI